ncbi:MAG: helix-turn-helix transcriptional regulator [Oscillospiraceae bacterium]|jgi:DNA-binding Xre family transcriptional regulator|nr:helix-turn-helix transcriptional regulator [Oscillospiraceae bacterium]MCI8758641.1 helix-turn-helix transcriptional regulator [Oscillospiraceae bacterium]MCI9563832.1 helix-turn-helix transcriptional regulator [Oscillospiraceae bacterium]
MKHSERIFQILEDRKITAYQLSKATGIAESSFGQWRKTPSSNIRSGNLVLIADYLNCSVDYLLGRTEDPELHQK